MQKVIILLVVFGLTLAACSGGPSQAMETTAVAEAEVEISPQTGTSQPEAAGASSSEALAGAKVYELVPAESTVTYEVGETFIREGNVFQTAVGKTQGVTGEIQVDFENPQSTIIGPLSVDISGLTSDSDRRDNAIWERFLESFQYPAVTFSTTSIEGLPAQIDPGTDYPVKLIGELTIRDETRPAVFDALVRLDSETISGLANTTFLMSEFGFGPISIMGMLNTEDEVKITVEFVARLKA